MEVVRGSPMRMTMGEESECAEDKNGVERRVWESQDFSITKIVIEEGGGDGGHPDGEMVTPRFGAVCSVQGEHMHMVYGLGPLGCLNSKYMKWEVSDVSALTLLRTIFREFRGICD